jgi:outer membrane protein assembly factor BamB
MRPHPVRKVTAGLLILGIAAGIARAGDWPMYGHDASRNMVAPGESGLISDADPATGRNVLWTAEIGSQSYGNATVAGGRVFLGTNNANPHDPKYTGDYGILLCLDEKTGKFDWQLAVPKLRAGKNSDWDEVGFCSSPTVDGDRVYAVSNRCEVLCLNVSGARGESKGPVVEVSPHATESDKPSIPLGSGDSAVIWRYDMRDELGVFPHNMTSSSVLVVGDKLFVTTSNGVDWTGKHLPMPTAPALICLDKKTGKLLARERSGISARTFYCNWSSPASGIVNGKPIVVFGGGDGFCYGFEVEPGPIAEDGIATLTEIWRCNCNPPDHLVKDGKPVSYGQPSGPCEVIATPVILDGRVYAAIGQEPEQGDGAGCLNCIDATRTGDISESGILWRNEKIGRSLSSVAISDGLLYLADFAGLIHCLDVQNGKEIWSHDTEAHIWGSTLVADGKIYAGNENGLLAILSAGREKKVLATIDLKDAIDSTPIAANRTVYVGTLTHLYALQAKEGK